MIDSSFLYLCSEWAIRLTMLLYVPQRRSAAATRTWLLFIFLLPWPGLVCYALFGRIHIPRTRLERQARASRRIQDVQEQMGRRFASYPALPSSLIPASILAQRLGDFEPMGGNSVEL